ncbi:putative chromatin regulator PHD family [Helianthus annuus]|nr:putative chromatin regulator PHD family [Helianthus annuus]KAJ0820601.1 putative chromatin regulator PHD family [Helianthus annuus]
MHRSYGIVDQASRTLVIVNARADDHRVDAIIDRKPAGLISVHDYNEDMITRVLFNEGSPPYRILHMGFTAIGGSLLMASLFNGTGTPEQNNQIAVKMASLVLRYESHLKDPLQTIENSVKVSRFFGKKEKEWCAICHDEYQAEDMIGTIYCKHTFHPQCILAWMRKKGNCPICRAVAIVI